MIHPSTTHTQRERERERERERSGREIREREIRERERERGNVCGHIPSVSCYSKRWDHYVSQHTVTELSTSHCQYLPKIESSPRGKRTIPRLRNPFARKAQRIKPWMRAEAGGRLRMAERLGLNEPTRCGLAVWY